MEEIRDKIAKIIEDYVEEIQLNCLKYDKNLKEMGLDSFTFVIVIVEIEEFFGVEIADEYLLQSEMSTVNRMADIVLRSKSCVE